MAAYERTTDMVSGSLSQHLISERERAGWQMVSIEWRKELPASEMRKEEAAHVEIPYGLRLSDDRSRLELHPYEDAVLMHMMDLVGEDLSYSSIVSDLNERGLQMRDGSSWTLVGVFKMMPRLIEVGPRIFADEKWKALQNRSISSPAF